MPALADHEVVAGSAQAAAEPVRHRCSSRLPWIFLPMPEDQTKYYFMLLVLYKSCYKND